MSPATTDRSFRSQFGKFYPTGRNDTPAEFARVISGALKQDFGDTTSAVKNICKLTGAQERAVKNWIEGKNGPVGRHLVALIAVSDAVLEAVLLSAGRADLVVAHKIVESKRQLLKLLQQLHDWKFARMTTPVDRSSIDSVLSLLKEIQMSDPTEIIREAVHSAFVKYPREDDPDFTHHWIKPEESAHVAKVILMELEAAGFQIVKKPS